MTPNRVDHAYRAAHNDTVDVECIHQATASVDIDSCYTDRQLHVHGEAQTPLVRFVVDVFYKQIRNKSTTNRTGGV